MKLVRFFYALHTGCTQHKIKQIFDNSGIFPFPFTDAKYNGRSDPVYRTMLPPSYIITFSLVSLLNWNRIEAFIIFILYSNLITTNKIRLYAADMLYKYL